MQSQLIKTGRTIVARFDEGEDLLDTLKANCFSGTLILKNKQESISLEIQNGEVLSEGH